MLQTNALINLCVDYRAIFIMSSPLNEESSRMVLLTKTRTKDPTEYLWEILNLAVICRDCHAKGDIECVHALENRTLWKSIKTQEILADLMMARYFRTEVGTQLLTATHPRRCSENRF